MKLSDYTPAQVQAARHYAASYNIRWASECMNEGYFKMYMSPAEKVRYQNLHINNAAEIIEGQHDNNFTIHQRMEVYLTGECTPLLPTIAVTGE